MAELVTVADKLSFVSKLTLLFKATSDDSEPTPGYMYDEINHISYESITYCEELEDWLNDRLNKRSSYVKLKVLRIMKYLVAKGNPKFRESLRKNSQGIAEATKHSGPPDALHGNAHYLAVRHEAQELSASLFTINDDDRSLSDSSAAGRTTLMGIGSMKSGGMHGFGNTANTASRSIGETIVDGLQDLAERVADSLSANSSGQRHDVTFVAPSSANSVGQFPGYKPIAVSSMLPGNSTDARGHRPEVYRKSRHEAVYRPGVAGGGWDDDEGEEDDDDDSRSQPVLETSTECFESSSRSDVTVTCNEEEEVEEEELSAESKLVNDFLLDSPASPVLPPRSELKAFIARCSGADCDKVVGLLAGVINQSSIAATTRSLLAIEALLRTDLVTPRHIAITCHRQLLALYTTRSNEDCVRQKARKLIRILEKLAPKQAALFSEVAINTDNVLSPVGDFKPQTAFPFLLTSNS